MCVCVIFSMIKSKFTLLITVNVPVELDCLLQHEYFEKEAGQNKKGENPPDVHVAPRVKFEPEHKETAEKVAQNLQKIVDCEIWRDTRPKQHYEELGETEAANQEGSHY